MHKFARVRESTGIRNSAEMLLYTLPEVMALLTVPGMPRENVTKTNRSDKEIFASR